MAKPKESSPAAKRRFRVYARSVDYFSVDILAESKDAALELAETVDGGCFESPGSFDRGEWEIESAEEVPEGQPFEPVDQRHYNTL